MKNWLDKFIKEKEKEWNEKFGTFDEYKKNVDKDTIPTEESLQIRDARLRLYMRIKSFICQSIEQAVKEAEKLKFRDGFRKGYFKGVLDREYGQTTVDEEMKLDAKRKLNGKSK